jgi:hypothetical protein
MTVDPNRSGTWFTVPMVSGEFRSVPDGSFKVWRPYGGDSTWPAISKGLPQPNAFLGVLREGMTHDGADPVGLYIGTNTGQIFYSIDGGDSWRQMNDYLPPILSVEASLV